jgi:hypothetical protein
MIHAGALDLSARVAAGHTEMCEASQGARNGDDMSRPKCGAWTQYLPLHRRVEDACTAECKKTGRTWKRLTYDDRGRMLAYVLVEQFTPDEQQAWATRYGIGDVHNRLRLPTPSNGRKAS